MIRIATVGTSGITEQFVNAIKMTDEFEHAAVYSRKEETGRLFCEKVNCKGVVYTSLEALAESDIEAVYIGSPNGCHYAQSKLFLQHGKHVLCEKPVTVTAAQYRELRELAQQQGVVFMEAIMSRHSTGRDILHGSVERAGTVSMARFDFCQLSSRYDAYRRGEHQNIFDMSLCAGALMDLGVYCVWAAVDLFGKPKSIRATACFDAQGTDLSGCAIFEYTTFCAVLTYGKTGQSKAASEIIGDAGTVKLRVVSLYAEVEEHPTNGEVIAHGPLNKIEVMRDEARQFAAFIEQPAALAAEYETLCEQTEIVRECMDTIVQSAGIVYPALAK